VEAHSGREREQKREGERGEETERDPSQEAKLDSQQYGGEGAREVGADPGGAEPDLGNFIPKLLPAITGFEHGSILFALGVAFGWCWDGWPYFFALYPHYCGVAAVRTREIRTAAE